MEPDPASCLEFDALPDELLHLVCNALRDRAHRLSDLMRLSRCCKRLLALMPVALDKLELSSSMLSHLGESMLTVPHARSQPIELSLLAPQGWAFRLCDLRILELAAPSWSAAARLVTLLHAWPKLEELELRFNYSSSTFPVVAGTFQQLADDLADVLQAGACTHLRYLWLGNLHCTHCFGQRGAGGASFRVLDDRAVLESLQPTAALWWMAERAHHCRLSKLHQFEYELEHGADVSAVVGTFGILAWMRERLSQQRHSRVGHREVQRLLVSKGATESAIFRPLSLPLRRWAATEEEESDSEGFTTDDYEDEGEDGEATALEDDGDDDANYVGGGDDDDDGDVQALSIYGLHHDAHVHDE